MNCSHIESSSMGNETFSWLISTKTLQIILSKRKKQPLADVLQKSALKNLAIFPRKHLKACNFVKKRLQQGVFSEYCETFKKTFFIDYVWWLLLEKSC